MANFKAFGEKITYNRWLCSVALINNTINNGNSYQLIAKYCIDNECDASLVIFYFIYENQYCINLDGQLDQSIFGSKIITLPPTKSLDFTLLKLSVIAFS